MKPSDEAKKTPVQRDREHAQRHKDMVQILKDKRAGDDKKGK